ncbi:MAG: hypothetical protein ABL966_10945, partial [Acidimicrobiales bacterium]
MVVYGTGSLIRGNRFVRNTIQDRYAFAGAAIWGQTASPVIDGNWFEGNRCPADEITYGTVAFDHGSSPVIT